MNIQEYKQSTEFDILYYIPNIAILYKDEHNAYHFISKICDIVIATQQNCSGTYTKYITFPFFSYIHTYLHTQLKIFNITMLYTKREIK